MNDKTDIKVGYVSSLKRICMTIGELPTSYLETMTYYEMLVWFVNYLRDNIIPTVNNNAEAVQELQTLYEELRTYVNNYFDNLDVQEEVNNKLDEMAESGQLTDIIAQYLGLAGMIAFDTVADMKLAENLVNGSKCETLGFRIANDGGGALYQIRYVKNDDVIDEATLFALYNPQLVAEIVVENELNVKQCGAYGDGEHDDSTVLQKIIAKDYPKLLFPNGEYLCNITIPKSISIDFDNSTLIPNNNNSIISISGSRNNQGYILSDNLARYDNTLTLTVIPQDIEAGDFILIRDDSLRPSDDLANINEEVHEVQSIADNVITLKDFIRWKKDVATSTYNVYKLNMIKDVNIKNLKLNITSNGTGLYGHYLLNVYVDNIQTENNINPAVTFDSSVNVNINNFVIKNSRNFDAGKGYGILIDHGCNNFTIKNGIGDKLRHLCDLSSSFDGYINNVSTYNMQQVAYGFAHNAFGSDITYENCKAYNQKWYGFSFGSQGVSDRNSVIANNCNVINCYVEYNEADSNANGVFFDVPAQNCLIEKFTYKAYSNTNGSGIRLNPINNDITIRDCYIEKANNGVFIEQTDVAESTDREYNINFENMSFNNCNSCYRITNVKGISINNTIANNTTTFLTFGAYANAKTNALRYINITNSRLHGITNFISKVGTSENIPSSDGCFGNILNNVEMSKTIPLSITVENGGRILTNETQLYTSIPTPNGIYLPITSESAVTLASATLTTTFLQGITCIIHNIGANNITIPQSFLMENGGSNKTLSPNQSATYMYRGSKWILL